jgi:hypothetical protein
MVIMSCMVSIVSCVRCVSGTRGRTYREIAALSHSSTSVIRGGDKVGHVQRCPDVRQCIRRSLLADAVLAYIANLPMTAQGHIRV